MKDFTIKAEPFSWNDNFSEVALEDFSMIQKRTAVLYLSKYRYGIGKIKNVRRTRL